MLSTHNTDLWSILWNKSQQKIVCNPTFVSFIFSLRIVYSIKWKNIPQLIPWKGGSNFNNIETPRNHKAWWRHQMETFAALLATCAGNSPVPGEFPAQRPVPQSFDVFFDLRLNKRLNKQSSGWWFETLSRPFWRHRNGMIGHCLCCLDAGLLYVAHPIYGIAV